MNISFLILLIVPILAALIAFALGQKSADRKWIERFALLSVSVELFAGLDIIFRHLSYGDVTLTPYLRLDALGAVFLIIILLLGTLGVVYSIFYLRKEGEREHFTQKKVGNYFALYQLFLLSMFVAVSADNVLLLWVAVEATTLASAFLINFFDRQGAIEAAWKYVIINSVALLLCLFGVFLFLAGLEHASTGILDLSWENILRVAPLINPDILKITFIFILIGYGTKMGLAPMHSWLPDAHSQAPVPVSALLSGALLNVALLALLRFKGIVDISLGVDFAQTLLLFLSVCSMVIAAVLILVQKEYKRMLAYSSIEHMGIILFGFALGGVAGFAALLHALYHSLAKSVLFLSSGNIALRYHTYEIKGVRGVLLALPVTGVLFMGGILAVAGVPPFGTFMTKFTILATGFNIHPILTSIAAGALVLAFVGLLRHASSMLFGKTEVESGESESGGYAPILVLFFLLIVLSVYIPAPLSALLKSAVAQL
jgi:hydrogenase-4 component F